MDEHIKTQVSFLIALNIFLVFVGMFTDGVTAILLVVPLILPLGYAYDVDPYHLCVIFLLNLEMGFLIPPVGMNLFISSIRFGKPVGYVCRTVIPYLVILTVVLGMVTYIPWISTYLPSFVKSTEEGVSLGGGYVKLKEDPEEAALPDDGAMDDLGDMLKDDDEPDAGAPDGGAADGGTAAAAPAEGDKPAAEGDKAAAAPAAAEENAEPAAEPAPKKKAAKKKQ
jgi:hypothetical protein